MSNPNQFKRQDQNTGPISMQNTVVSAYYQSLFGRNVIDTTVIPAFLKLVCLPKLFLEVFTRRKMGERYFSKSMAVLIAILLYFLPQLLMPLFHWRDTTTYYTFYMAYVIMAAYCFVEVKREPSVFDFARFSLDPGKCLPFFKRIKIFGKTPTQRTIDVWLEPLFCFGVGFLLLLLHQNMTGVLIVFCSLCYFVSNYSFALRGDHFIMDQIDLIICNQDLTETMMQNLDVSPRGMPFSAKKPSTKELRENLVAAFIDDYEDAAVAK
jgi:hypothetical protein